MSSKQILVERLGEAQTALSDMKRAVGNVDFHVREVKTRIERLQQRLVELEDLRANGPARIAEQVKRVNRLRFQANAEIVQPKIAKLKRLAATITELEALEAADATYDQTTEDAGAPA